MKRLFYIFLLFCTLSLLFSSCKDSTPKPLCWQTYPIKRQITIEKGEKKVEADLLLEQTEMSLTLGGQNSGTVFHLQEGTATLISGELTLPITKERLPEEGLLFDALTLPADAALFKSTEKLAGKDCTVFTYVTDEVNFRYYLDENAVLLRIVIEKEEHIAVHFG